MQFYSWSQRSKTSVALSAALLLGIGLVGTTTEASAHKRHHKHHHHYSNDAASVAMKTADVSTTVTALKKAGAVGMLRIHGPITVFAPSNAGWAKMTKENREGLMNDPKRLKEVLKYHVVKGKYTASDLADKRSLKTVEGESLMIDNKSGTVVVDGCIVTTADVPCDNGVIHIIDAVAIPERGK
ncbi:hypothetical protein BH11CYA1_BH11CYA1_30470 [soil metagenome]